MGNRTIFSLLIVRAAVALALISLSSPVEAAERIVSKYTSTARAKALSFKDESNEPEGGFEAVFAGLGGYKLVHLSGDERSWINIRFGKNTVDLYSATVHAGGGTFPHKANDVVEWRGTEEKGRFVPYAIIYRIAAGNDETREIHARLVVIKLDKERSAVIGHTEGANEEKEAHEMADKLR
ncbi:MAG TPA: hypothetical protein VH188_00160 [Chthoniobacterales bacterium]|jgi:hypothetical protein|nr:hypothetical protein [Chthoniobacterales bacterium]